jgi:hypothetical protein
MSAWPPWGGTSCAFDGHGRLWYARPGHERGRDLVVMVDPRTGSTLAEQRLGTDEGCYQFNPCPDPDDMLIELSCGQDGCFLYHAHFNGSKIAIQEYPSGDRTFSEGFTSDGREFVTGAQEGDSVQVHALADGNVVASLDSEAIFGADDLACEEPDGVGYQAVFLNNERILIDTRFRRLVVIDRPSMEVLGCLWPEGYKLKPFDGKGKPMANPANACSYGGNLDSFHCGAPGELLAVFGSVVRLLDVSEALR